ncbi:MAG: NUDIX domain-containing protein [Alphaproteobacteria bacterium]|nr:NUDIX domain-containing protein [Alphaproteobacteria bacterium]
MTEPDRQMIHFRFDGRVFNHRAAGIAIRDGHVLVCREDDDPYTLLPGGRIEFGEDSRTTLTREIEEELKAPGVVGRLVFTAETFFRRDAREFHELGVYYAITPPENLPFVTGKTALVTQDEGHVLHFDWVPIAGDALALVNLLPRWLRGRLADLPAAPEHLIIDEK